MMKQLFLDSIAVKKAVVESDALTSLTAMGETIVSCIMDGGKLMLCGNGGSAADAQHLAAELLIRLRPAYNRQGLPALSLAQDTSTITACGNDIGYDALFERVLRALGNKGDVLLAITTSGNSSNVIRAMQAAREMKVAVFGFLGSGGGHALALCDRAFVVPSDNTGRIQETHITAGHALMEYVETRLLETEFLTLQKN